MTRWDLQALLPYTEERSKHQRQGKRSTANSPPKGRWFPNPYLVSTAPSVPPGTCLHVLCSSPLPAARAVVAEPGPQRQNPQRSFAAANVRKRSSAEHPPPPCPRPHPAARPLAAATLATPGAPESRRRGCPAGSPGATGGGRGTAATSPRPAGGRSPPPARPSAPRRSRARAGAPLTPPRRAGARAGCVGYIGLGSASGAPRAVALGGCLSPPNSRGLSRLSLLSLPSPPPSLLLSCPSALFSGLITFRIKAKPSPGSSNFMSKDLSYRKSSGDIYSIDGVYVYVYLRSVYLEHIYTFAAA
ncbi:uncharacterized protein LOC111173528 [Delphinapterus leucas]|uniref:Uncharacterized protein LOC111173528 n=1 Tax=Delphinapterus leucas TaxID=9749 RepID=A0A7F8KDT4_DELLE|nr:uncharacterized protein LOC111173528 [Delphinapterus leucas]